MPERLAAYVQADIRRLARRIFAGMGLLSLLILGGGWMTDHRSCLRQQPYRDNSHAAALLSLKTATYFQEHGRTDLATEWRHRAHAQAEVPGLNCNALLPGD